MKLIVNSHQVPISGEQLRKWRKARGLSQTDLARLAGISRSYIAEMERRDRQVRMLVATAIARSLKVGLEKLTA